MVCAGSGACHRSDSDRYSDEAAAHYLTTVRVSFVNEPANFELPP
jgi:hypothetical protein